MSNATGVSEWGSPAVSAIMLVCCADWTLKIGVCCMWVNTSALSSKMDASCQDRLQCARDNEPPEPLPHSHPTPPLLGPCWIHSHPSPPCPPPLTPSTHQKICQQLTSGTLTLSKMKAALGMPLPPAIPLAKSARRWKFSLVSLLWFNMSQ